MRSRILALAVVALMLAMAAPASAARTATLVDVHEVKQFQDIRKAKPPAKANCSNDGAGSGQYALTGWSVAAARTAVLTESTVPSGLGDIKDDLQRAFDVWTGTPKISVAGGGTATRHSANRAHELLFRNGGGAIAVTYTWRWSDGMIESDVVFNSGLPWFVEPTEGDGCYENIAKYEVGNIATHEFGHVLGLDHPASGRYETMYAYGYTGETLKQSPNTGDRNGINAAY